MLTFQPGVILDGKFGQFLTSDTLSLEANKQSWVSAPCLNGVTFSTSDMMD